MAFLTDEKLVIVGAAGFDAAWAPVHVITPAVISTAQTSATLIILFIQSALFYYNSILSFRFNVFNSILIYVNVFSQFFYYQIKIAALHKTHYASSYLLFNNTYQNYFYSRTRFG